MTCQTQRPTAAASADALAVMAEAPALTHLALNLSMSKLGAGVLSRCTPATHGGQDLWISDKKWFGVAITSI